MKYSLPETIRHPTHCLLKFCESLKIGFYSSTDWPTNRRRCDENSMGDHSEFAVCNVFLFDCDRCDALGGKTIGLAVNFGRACNAWLRWVKTTTWKFNSHYFAQQKQNLIMNSNRSILGTYYSFKQYWFLKSRPPTDTNVNTNLSLWLDTLVQNPNFWLYTGIGAAIVLVIILLVVLVLRKRIVIAIALVKEGSKYVYGTNYSLVCTFRINYLLFTNQKCRLFPERLVQFIRRFSSQYSRGSSKLPWHCLQ